MNWWLGAHCLPMVMVGTHELVGGCCIGGPSCQYFLMPYRFLQESTGMEPNSTGFHWIPLELVHSCKNRTGIQIFLSLYSVIF
jgi:hypothetical protein